MTLVDDSTDVLPPIAQAELADEPEERPTPIGLIVVLALTVLAFIVATLLIGEAIARADVEQAVAAEVRTVQSLPASQHVGVTVEGSALLQGIVKRLDVVHVSIPNAPFAGSTADATETFTGLERLDGGGFRAERVSAVYSLGAAQATSLYVPEDARGKMQIGFRGADMTLSLSMKSAGRTVPVSVALTPAFQNGWVSSALASVTVAGTTVSADDLRATLGDETLAAVQVPPVCVAAGLPRAASIRDVTVRDQHLRVEVVVDAVLLATPEGRQPGACS